MPTQVTKIRFVGQLAGGEVWSTGFALMNNTGPITTNLPDMEAWADSIALLQSGAIVPPGLRAQMSTAVSITTVRLEQYNPDGTLDLVVDRVLNNPVAGTGTLRLPYATAVCASLLTSRAGRSYRGRMYWPLLAVSLETATGRITTATAQSIADDVRATLQAAAGAAPAGYEARPAVVSQTRGELTPVTTIRVGDVPDSQRRRRDNLAESYAGSSTLP